MKKTKLTRKIKKAQKQREHLATTGTNVIPFQRNSRSTPSPSARQYPVRVLSYNIHKGFTTGNRRFILDRIRDAIRTMEPDLVLLQEVLGEHTKHAEKYKDWPGLPQFDYLAHELWPHVAYGKNAVYGAGHHGNAILSKYPFRLVENIDVSTNKLEKRGVLHAIIEVPGQHRPVHAICVHLGLFEAERQTQIRSLCARIETHVPHEDPLVIGGDFNDWMLKCSRPLQRLLDVREAFAESAGAHAKTFPSWMPSLRLDRIYYRGMDLGSTQVLTGKPWSQLSDHVALYAELSI
jgi:endonuclease/exonuclease/phosphatase family metal-dependent hydrolase